MSQHIGCQHGPLCRSVSFLILCLTPLLTQAVPLEVVGIRADPHLRVAAPAGCGDIQSWHGDLRDMDGSARSHAHRGIDIVAPAGTPVIAAAPGKVIYQGKTWAGGNSLLIWHGKDHFGNRVISYYVHLQEFKTQEQKLVERGEVLLAQRRQVGRGGEDGAHAGQARVTNAGGGGLPAETVRTS